MSPAAKPLAALSLAGALAAWLGLACVADSFPEPGVPGGDFIPGGGSKAGADAGMADAGEQVGGGGCAAICGEAIDADGCTPPAGAPDCSHHCFEVLTAAWANGTFGIDAVGKVSPICELAPPLAPCTGLTGDVLNHCLAPFLERCTEVCRCQTGCSALFAVQHDCNAGAFECSGYQGCVSQACTRPTVDLADTGCQAGRIRFELDGVLRSGCATAIDQGAFVVASASGSEDGSVYDLRLTIEKQAGVHAVSPLDPVRHAQLGVNVGAQSFVSDQGVVLVNSTSGRLLIGAFKAQVVATLDPEDVREISGSFFVRY